MAISCRASIAHWWSTETQSASTFAADALFANASGSDQSLRQREDAQLLRLADIAHDDGAAVVQAIHELHAVESRGNRRAIGHRHRRLALRIDAPQRLLIDVGCLL